MASSVGRVVLPHEVSGEVGEEGWDGLLSGEGVWWPGQVEDVSLQPGLQLEQNVIKIFQYSIETFSKDWTSADQFGRATNNYKSLLPQFR